MKRRLFIIAALWMGLVAAGECADDYAQLTQNYKDFCLYRAQRISSRRFAVSQNALEVARALRADGSWADVDYTDDTRGGWQPYKHLHYISTMVRAYKMNGSPLAGNAELKAAIHKALLHWLHQDYQCPNWWYNVIGVPQSIGEIGILMQEELTPEEYELVVNKILPRGKIGMTGQNRVWVASITLVRGLLKKDEALVRQAAGVLGEEIRVTTKEGVQPDFSFHQHGPQQQFGNYGLSFASSAAMWLRVFDGTPFEFPKEKLDIVHDYLTEGESWVVWRGRMDLSSCNRQLSDGSQEGKGRSVAGTMALLSQVDPARAGDYQAFIKRNAEGGENDLVGNRHFWRSDYMIQRGEDYYASVKMASRRVIGGEVVNSENVSGYYLADGALLLMRSGKEYEDIQPVWDWCKIPGTTAPQRPEGPPRLSKRYNIDSDFVGGVSDGNEGCAALDYVRDGVQAKKAWFFTHDDAIICLGAGIASESELPVVTTINQCFLKGEVTIGLNPPPGRIGPTETFSDKAGTLPRGEHQCRNLGWAWHDGVGYVFPEGANVKVRQEEQRGSWRKVEEKPAVSGREVKGDVLLMTLEHGVKPRGADYAYILLPDRNANETSMYTARPEFRVVANTTRIQAVAMSDKAIQAVFHEAGTLQIPEGGAIVVDRPCLLLLSQWRDTINITVADPTQKLESLNVTVNGKTVAVKLPRGGEAGKSVEIEMKDPQMSE